MLQIARTPTSGTEISASTVDSSTSRHLVPTITFGMARHAHSAQTKMPFAAKDPSGMASPVLLNPKASSAQPHMPGTATHVLHLQITVRVATSGTVTSAPQSEMETVKADLSGTDSTASQLVQEPTIVITAGCGAVLLVSSATSAVVHNTASAVITGMETHADQEDSSQDILVEITGEAEGEIGNEMTWMTQIGKVEEAEEVEEDKTHKTDKMVEVVEAAETIRMTKI